MGFDKFREMLWCSKCKAEGMRRKRAGWGASTKTISQTENSES